MIRALKKAFSLAICALALAACGGSGTQTAGIDRGRRDDAGLGGRPDHGLSAASS